MNNFELEPVGQIVAKDYRAAQVLRSYGLDFCCGGTKPLAEACKSKNISLNEILSDLEIALSEPNSGVNYDEWSLSFLSDYIVENHHIFVKKNIPELLFYSQKVANRHGEAHPELIKINVLVEKLADELLSHLEKEEEEAFPQIKLLEQSNGEVKLSKDAIEILVDEHETAGAIMEEIQELTNNFTPPANACASYQVLYKSLDGFQRDLHKHVHLENNILFLKALKLNDK